MLKQTGRHETVLLITRPDSLFFGTFGRMRSLRWILANWDWLKPWCHQGSPLALRPQIYNMKRKLTFQTVGVEFERCGCLASGQDLMKNTMVLHYGKCRLQCVWSLGHTRDYKSGHSDFCCLESDHPFQNLNQSLASPQLYGSAILQWSRNGLQKQVCVQGVPQLFLNKMWFLYFLYVWQRCVLAEASLSCLAL